MITIINSLQHCVENKYLFSILNTDDKVECINSNCSFINQVSYILNYNGEFCYLNLFFILLKLEI